MGDRALVLVKDGDSKPECAIYSHWGGQGMPDSIRKCGELMKDRRGDASYFAARMVGTLHDECVGALSLGIFGPPDNLDEATLKEFSHGDAGVFVVDATTGEVTNVGGGDEFKEPFNCYPAEESKEG